MAVIWLMCATLTADAFTLKCEASKNPVELYNKSVRMGIWDGRMDVRKYRDDKETAYLIKIGSGLYYTGKKPFETDAVYLVCPDKKLMELLAYLNAVRKEMLSPVRESGEIVKDIKYLDCDLLAVTFVNNFDSQSKAKEVKAMPLCFIKTGQYDFKSTGDWQLVTDIHFHEVFDDYGLSTSDLYHALMGFDSVEKLDNLVSLLRKSKATDASSINPDTYETHTYNCRDIHGENLQKNFLIYRKGDNVKYYIQGEEELVDHEFHPGYLWVGKEAKPYLIKWLKTLLDNFINDSAKKSEIFKEKMGKSYEAIDLPYPAGYIIGDFDVEMTVYSGGAVDRLAARVRLVDDNDYAWLGIRDRDLNIVFDFFHPDDLKELIELLENN